MQFDGKHLSARLAIQDEQLILDIDAGKRSQVSAGYLAGTRFEDGVSPDGEAYDAVRETVEYNHTAVVSRGRAGADVCLALDSIEELTQDEDSTMSLTFTIDGAAVGADKAQAAFDARELKLRSELDAVNLRVEATTTELDSLKAELEQAKADLAAAKSAETLDAAVQAQAPGRRQGSRGPQGEGGSALPQAVARRPHPGSHRRALRDHRGLGRG